MFKHFIVWRNFYTFLFFFLMSSCIFSILYLKFSLFFLKVFLFLFCNSYAFFFFFINVLWILVFFVAKMFDRSNAFLFSTLFFKVYSNCFWFFFFYIVFSCSADHFTTYFNFVEVFSMEHLRFVLSLQIFFYPSTGFFRFFFYFDAFISFIFFALFFFFLTFFIFFFFEDFFKSSTSTFLDWNLLIILHFLFCFSCLILYSSELFLFFLNFIGLNVLIYTLIVLEDHRLVTMEAALKYFILSTASSLFFLGGVCFMFIFWHTTVFLDLRHIFMNDIQYFLVENLKVINGLLLILKSVDLWVLNFDQFNIFFNSFFFYDSFFRLERVKLFLVVSFLAVAFIFKLSLFPFHSWAAELYSVLSFRSLSVFLTMLKLIFFVKLLQFFFWGFYLDYFFFGSVYSYFILFVSLGSVIFGSFAGFFEDKLKKIIAFSSINQLGFALLGLLSSTRDSTLLSDGGLLFCRLEGFKYVFFFLIVYFTSNFLLSLIFILFSKRIGRVSYVWDLSNKSFFLLFPLIVVFFSFSGLPPLAGFFSKFYLLAFSWALGYKFSSALVLFCSLISAYYYLKLIKIIVFDTKKKYLTVTSEFEVFWFLPSRFSSFTIFFFFNKILFFVPFVISFFISFFFVFHNYTLYLSDLLSTSLFFSFI